MKDLSGGVHPRQLSDGWDAYHQKAERKGYELARIRYRFGGEFSRLMEILEAGDAACIAVDYSKVPRHLSGDPLFTGFHSIFVAGIARRDGKPALKVYDPLCDGRRTGIPGPGPVWWTPLILKRATAGYAGEGKATWNAMARSIAIAPKPDTCADQVAALRDELGAAHEEIARMQDVMTQAASAMRALDVGIDQVVDLLEGAYGKADPDAGVTTGMAQ